MKLLTWFRELFKPPTIKDLDARLPLQEIKKRARILVIDDDADSFPTEKLREEQYNIEVWDKVKSISRLEDGEFDVIILDYAGVADESISSDAGLGVLEHIKKVNPSQLVVAFSAKAFEASKSNFWKLADDNLGKPVDAIKCKEVIDQLLLDKFNLGYYWQSVASIFKEKGLSEGEIKKIEIDLAKALRDGKQDGITSVLTNFGKKLELSARFGVAVAKMFSMIPGA